jgi:hypothetical protein
VRDALSLRLAGGVQVRAKLGAVAAQGGRVQLAVLTDCVARRGDVEVLRSERPYLWLLGSEVRSIAAGGLGGHEIASERPSIRVPKPRNRDTHEAEMLSLYEQSFEALRSQRGSPLSQSVARICARLDAAYPDEWLLRYELLAALPGLDASPNLQARLTAQLEDLETRYAHREPIATGLAYLRGRSMLKSEAS